MERNTSSDKASLPVPVLRGKRRREALTLLLLLATACQRLTIPVITGTRIHEVEPAVVEVTATVTASQIDECGICYSTTNTSPTPEHNDGIIYARMDGDQLQARATLAAHTTYYIAVFATNDAGRTVSSTALKFTTSHVTPTLSDNPLPGI